jgi:ribosome biogenesis ATPase
MSVHLKNTVKKIIKENNVPISLDEIIIQLKNMPEYQRMKADSLKPTIKKLLKEMKKEKEKEKEEKEKEKEKELNSDTQSFLNKKRNLPKNKIPISINSTNTFNPEKFLYEPNIKLNSLGGMNEIIQRITELISNPLNYYSAYKELNTLPIKGLLLCGPPGCGKTTLAYGIGGQFGIPFYKITGPDIISSLSGESEQIIRNLFNEVTQSAPSILFIDEIETIIGRREAANKEMERRIVAQIMTCIDDINEKQFELNAPVFIIGATSKPEFIDSSMRRSGRLDVEIHIGFPSVEMREEMLKSITKKNKISPKINFAEIAKKTPGYLAADLQALCRAAGHNAINRLIKNDKETNKINNDIIQKDEEKNNNDNNNISVEEDDEKIKNLYIEQEDFALALTQIQPTSKREGFSTIPNVTWDNVGGLKDLREELYYDIVLPIINPQKLKLVGISKAAGVLLYGPPGCGKTLLAKAVANEAKANFISIKGPELLNKYVGESERAIRSLFIRAKNSSPCIIFFDELDALVPKRSNENNNSGERVVNQLLTEMDGLEDRKQIFIIAATNRPDIIDPAMLRPGRLDKLLYVPLPDFENRCAILDTITKNLKLDMDIDFEKIYKDKRIEGFSGADIASLVREAQLHALKRLNQKEKENENEEIKDFKINMSDFEYSLNNILPSVSLNDKKKYENLKKKLQESRSHLI